MSKMNQEEKGVLVFMMVFIMILAALSPVSFELYHLSSHADEIVQGEFHVHQHDGHELSHSHDLVKNIGDEQSDQQNQNNMVNVDLTIKVNKIVYQEKPVTKTDDTAEKHEFVYLQSIESLYTNIDLPPPITTLV